MFTKKKIYSVQPKRIAAPAGPVPRRPNQPASFRRLEARCPTGRNAGRVYPLPRRHRIKRSRPAGPPGWRRYKSAPRQVEIGNNGDRDDNWHPQFDGTDERATQATGNASLAALRVNVFYTCTRLAELFPLRSQQEIDSGTQPLDYPAVAGLLETPGKDHGQSATTC